VLPGARPVVGAAIRSLFVSCLSGFQLAAFFIAFQGRDNPAYFSADVIPLGIRAIFLQTLTPTMLPHLTLNPLAFVVAIGSDPQCGFHPTLLVYPPFSRRTRDQSLRRGRVFFLFGQNNDLTPLVLVACSRRCRPPLLSPFWGGCLLSIRGV